MSSGPVSFEIRNLGSADGLRSAEAVVVIGGQDRLALLGRTEQSNNTWVGLYPEDVLGSDSPLLWQDEPHDAFVAVCSCRFLECGGLVARISKRGDVVIWDNFRDGSDIRPDERPIFTYPFAFRAAEYRSAVLETQEPLSAWKPTTRIAADLVNEQLSGARQQEDRVRFAGCAHLDDSSVGLSAFLGRSPDPDWTSLRCILSLEQGESAESLAARAIELVLTGAILTDSRTVHRNIARSG